RRDHRQGISATRRQCSGVEHQRGPASQPAQPDAKMSRPILSRPRTRVYGCNYDKGESYYKPTIENLDRKYSGRPLFSEPRTSLADEIAARRSDIGSRDLAGTSRHGAVGRGDFELDLDPPAPATTATSGSSLLGGLRRAAAQLDAELAEETVFDIRGQRSSRPRRQQRSLIDEALAEESETSWATPAEPASFTRWSKLGAGATVPEEDDGWASGAASRARLSRARLSDLEQEMEEIAEKQARREKRAAALRAFVNESCTPTADLVHGSELATSSAHSLVRSERSEKHEKHVTF
ncbi:hypothetical protein QAD02_021963, partial [Eretmocerus hayati]